MAMLAKGTRAALFGRAIRRRAVGALTLVAAAATAWLLLLLLRAAAADTPRAALRRLQSAPPERRAAALAAELAAWRHGPPPRALAAAAAACTPRDAADALLRGAALSACGVVDVGANGGYPVTSMALRRAAAWTLAVEPDERNWRRLLRQKRHAAAAFLPVHGAAGAAAASATMRFHKLRDDFSCFNCLDAHSSHVFERNVSVYTLDQLVVDAQALTVAQPTHGVACSPHKLATAPIRLLKTDTQGHERAVLQGARRLLSSKRVQYVMIEFDPKLFQTRLNAMRALAHIFAAGFHCVQLALAGFSHQARLEHTFPFFGARPVTNQSASEFYHFIRTSGKYTDLLCSSR